jgi:transcriptional regulator with XRE-family HTH domain
VRDISKLAEIRKRCGLTQERLSELSGVHRVTIARYELGLTSPTVRNLEKLSAVLCVPVSELIDKKGA